MHNLAQQTLMTVREGYHNIVAGVGDHLIIEYVGGPQDQQADPHKLSDGATNPALAIVATTNSQLNYEFVVAGCISIV